MQYITTLYKASWRLFAPCYGEISFGLTACPQPQVRPLVPGIGFAMKENYGSLAVSFESTFPARYGLVGSWLSDTEA
jgi:hypothetical protein